MLEKASRGKVSCRISENTVHFESSFILMQESNAFLRDTTLHKAVHNNNNAQCQCVKKLICLRGNREGMFVPEEGVTSSPRPFSLSLWPCWKSQPKSLWLVQMSACKQNYGGGCCNRNHSQLKFWCRKCQEWCLLIHEGMVWFFNKKINKMGACAIH